MAYTRRTGPMCASCSVCPKVEWAELSANELTRVTSNKFARGYEAGSSLFEQGDDPKGVYCLEEGHVFLRRFDRFGNETSFGVTEAGSTLGWRSFFAGEAHAATAIALTPIKVCLIPGSVVLSLLRENSDLSLRYLKTVARDPGPRDALALRTPLIPVRVRMINLLLLLSRHSANADDKGSVAFKVPMKRRQIASMVGAREETLSRIISDLHADGLAIFNGRQITIPDVRRLYEESMP